MGGGGAAETFWRQGLERGKAPPAGVTLQSCSRMEGSSCHGATNPQAQQQMSLVGWNPCPHPTPSAQSGHVCPVPLFQRSHQDRV